MDTAVPVKRDTLGQTVISILTIVPPTMCQWACADLVNGYSCTCQAGYTGTNCDKDIDDCATNPCVNGACADLVNGHNCTCQAGYSGTNSISSVPLIHVLMALVLI